MGPQSSVRLVGEANHCPCRPGFLTESTLSLSLFLLIATIHGQILRRGLPLPLTNYPYTLPYLPFCALPLLFLVVSHLPLLRYHLD